MKSLFYILFCSLFLLSTAPISAAADQLGTCSVYIIIDESWSTEHSNKDLCSLAGQAITSLSSGDYLEVITISSSKPQIRLAQSIKTGSPDETRQIKQVLTKIRSKFLNDAKLSKAVEFSLNRIQRSRANKSAPAFIMVFSDGKRSDSDARAMERMYPKLATHNVPILMTGTRKTNRKFLIAANKGLMDFCLLADANPSKWLREQLEARGDKDSNRTFPSGTIKDKQPSDSSLEISARSETNIKFPKAQTPKITDSKPLEIKSVEAKKEIVLPKPKQVKKTPVKKEPAKAVEKPVAKTTAKEIKKLPPSIMSRLFWGLLMALALLLTFFILSYRRARDWKAKTQKILKRTLRPSGTLIARYKEQFFHLGRIDKLRQIHIGSSAKNTIRIFDNSVSPQHVRIFRRFGRLMLENLSSKTIYTNGIPVKPKLTSRLTLPCVLKLSDSITVKLEFQKQLTLNSSEKEASNETQK
jgi:hypothetical protein